MRPEEAKSQLDACTLRPQDADADARALAASNPELQDWLTKRTAEDEQMASLFITGSDIPSGMNERLLASLAHEASGSVSRPRKPTIFRTFIPWTAAAVAAVIAILITLDVRQESNFQDAWQNEAIAFISQLDHGEARLDKMSSDLRELTGYLPTAKGPTPCDLPANFAELNSLGCKVITVAGRPASVICFRLPCKREVHLVVIDNTGMRNQPPPHQPEFTQRNGWRLARWSEGSQSFLLVTHADEKALKGVFGLAMLTSPYLR